MIYIPGFKNNGVKDNSVTAIRSAYRERDDHNVIVLDWTYYARNTFYASLIPQLRIVRDKNAFFCVEIHDCFTDLRDCRCKFEEIPG